jgi:hypothetical protein
VPETLEIIDGENSTERTINTTEALQVGFIANDQVRACSIAPKKLYSGTRSPGEVIYFAEQLGFWERVDGDLVR